MKITGLEIKARRKAINWTQQELSDKIHVTVRTVQRWEDGEIIPDNMQLLLALVFQNEEKGDKVSATPGRVIYISRQEFEQNPNLEILIKLV